MSGKVKRYKKYLAEIKAELYPEIKKHVQQETSNEIMRLNKINADLQRGYNVMGNANEELRRENELVWKIINKLTAKEKKN